VGAAATRDPVPARHRRPTPIRSPPTRWVRPPLQDRSTIAAVIWDGSSFSVARGESGPLSLDGWQLGMAGSPPSPRPE